MLTNELKTEYRLGPDDIDVIILNYRTSRLAIEAARSASENGAKSIIIVDNYSEDNSLPVLQKGIEDIASIHYLNRNRGFSGGNNWGARLGKRPLILFMNADSRLHEGSLNRMIETVNEYGDAGAVGPALFFPDGRPQESAYFFISPLRIVNEMTGINAIGNLLRLKIFAGNKDPVHNGLYTGPVESLYGPCLLIRRKAFDRVGGFDERFFLYCEETDFLLRLRKAGWKAYRAAEAKVTHFHGASSTSSSIQSFSIMQESLIKYAGKHFNFFGRTVTACSCILGLMIRCLLAPSENERKRYWAALGVWLGWTQIQPPVPEPRTLKANPEK